MKLKELLNKKLAEHCESITVELFNKNLIPEDELQKQHNLVNEVFDELHEVYTAFKTISSGQSIKFSDDFCDTLREVLSLKPYILYDRYEVREEVTDADLEPFANDIENGNLDACKDILKVTKKYESLDYALFMNFTAVLANLYHVLRGLVYRAKHFDSFAAGERLLRALSLARRFARRFDHITPAGVDELVDCLENGMEELSIAADYASIGTWADYLAKEYNRPEAK